MTPKVNKVRYCSECDCRTVHGRKESDRSISFCRKCGTPENVGEAIQE